MLFPDKKWQFSRMFLENFWFQTDSSNTLIQLQQRIMRRIRGYVKVCGVKSGWACKRTSQVFCRYILTVVGRIIRNSWANREGIPTSQENIPIFTGGVMPYFWSNFYFGSFECRLAGTAAWTGSGLAWMWECTTPSTSSVWKPWPVSEHDVTSKGLF